MDEELAGALDVLVEDVQDVVVLEMVLPDELLLLV